MPNDDEVGENIRMIVDSARSVVPPDGDLSRIRSLRFEARGFDPSIYRTMAEMGWLALRLPDEAGGLGLGMREYCALAEVLGAGLTPEPLISAALACRLLGCSVPKNVLAGERVVLAAWQDGPSDLQWRRGVTLDEGTATGGKQFVPMAAGAGAFAIPTQDGVAVVDAAAAGLELDLRATQDGGQAGQLRLSATAIELTVRPADVDAALDEATLATAAYLLGLAGRAFEITREYLVVRKQFGHPIGSFQALQHRAADMKIQIELTRASVAAAAAAFDGEADPRMRPVRASQAKARASETALLVAREAIQMHGAIGYTDECDIGLYVRKAMTVANTFGTAACHRRRYASLTSEPAAI
ncbi:MAG: acyl-CoA/acyl-ACP dehydrogenase [Hyphomicrobiales bacterium]|nr:acyl-CoA/acyl-ACP dehydrogenase [Hyphomicrobiales bacterium]